jgi:hypothetical protein
MQSPTYSMEEALEWLDQSQTLLSSVLSFVGEARAPLTDVEVEHLRRSLVLALDVILNIVRDAAHIEPDGRACTPNPNASLPFPGKLLDRFNNISQMLVWINESLESRTLRLN